jgi:hypothetical protein
MRFWFLLMVIVPMAFFVWRHRCRDCGGNFLQSKAGSADGAGFRVDAAAVTTESAALRQ